ncbi:sll0403 [Synechocystis sp. PCC 6803]|uniref:Sll0403 protein n=1 Tax=Synechocystis sp. (strain ATCC 27184 / PCC 6803 / Kazusa) TaxID=1111708 RepID=Q55126_SYNY3|nr:MULTISPECIES: hypothetical protein [unclassified Synechocystis]BAM54395.1 hypothetical protein BEST7613_5464 [Synechocystis sp. PCC 6803] [Bacillus subtilis BEST7613]AGF52550.1 hypothetical protein MYO_123180 [Synechocystis sp. PCC 6803]ALJ68477.1 hypothetical protein AOY38_11925 [Synechocystis sp. PCC 6803]AVP90319.1 hypothetical protein C7I86_11990 [Synechocystis sp. IPPAS B-1465]MBD2616945.1 hypothetical protein [Synechocystis sp. FACHB-898]
MSSFNQITTIFSRKVQIGQLTVPVAIAFYLLVFSATVCILNYKYLQEYNQLMEYIKKYYPDIYEEIRQKPDVGNMAYSKGYKRLKPLIKLSNSMDSFDDPKLNKLVSQFIKFDRNFMIFSSVLIAITMIIGLAVGILYLN